jgi:hypothetical protein
MSKRKTERLLEEIRRMAERLSESDSSLSREEVLKELRETGIDPDNLKSRFHQAAKQLAEKERLADRMVPLSLQQAIDSTRPNDRMPRDPGAAGVFAERWLDKFLSSFSLPPNVEVVRAYHRSGDLSESDQADLDRLEAELREKVKKENERKG